MKCTKIAVSAAALTLSACAAPLVSLNEISAQPKAEYAEHWQELADRTVERFAATLHTEAPEVFVAPGPSDMAFAAAFKRDLEGSLLKHGYRVANSAAGAEVLNFEVQPFLYRQKDVKQLVEYATFWTTIAAIGSQLRHVSSVDTGAGIVAAAGPAIDILSYLNSHTNAEVVVTTSVVDPRHLHYVDAENMYVEPSDIPLYLSRMPPQAAQYTSGDAAELPVVNLAVRGRY